MSAGDPMGRTRLRGIRLAGLCVAVEAPAELPWNVAEGPLERFACSPHEPDVYVGVRVGRPTFRVADPVAYACGRRTFEIGRTADGWAVAVHGRQRFERVAHFDDAFREGEVVLRSEALSSLAAAGPLAHPLDELIVLHRIARERGVVLRGSALVRDRRALVFIGSRREPAAESSEPLEPTPPRSDEAVLDGDRIVLRVTDRGVRVYGVPWRADEALPLSAEVEAIHAIEGASAVFAEPLDVHDAGAMLLAHVFAPVHDARGAQRAAVVAEEVARRVPVLRLGLPSERGVVPFTWGHRQAALGFAPPFLA